MTNNDLQNITHKTKDRIKRTPLKTGMNFGRVASNSCSTSGTAIDIVLLALEMNGCYLVRI